MTGRCFLIRVGARHCRQQDRYGQSARCPVPLAISKDYPTGRTNLRLHSWTASLPVATFGRLALALLVCPVSGQLLLRSGLGLRMLALEQRYPGFAIGRDFALVRHAHQIGCKYKGLLQQILPSRAETLSCPGQCVPADG
jgi:hypothetical protein